MSPFVHLETLIYLLLFVAELSNNSFCSLQQMNDTNSNPKYANQALICNCGKTNTALIRITPLPLINVEL